MTTTHTRTFTTVPVLVEIDSEAAERVFVQEPTEMNDYRSDAVGGPPGWPAGLAGLIERAVVDALKDRLEPGHGERIRAPFPRCPVAVVFRDHNGVYRRFRDGYGVEQLSTPPEL